MRGHPKGVPERWCHQQTRRPPPPNCEQVVRRAHRARNKPRDRALASTLKDALPPVGHRAYPEILKIQNAQRMERFLSPALDFSPSQEKKVFHHRRQAGWPKVRFFKKEGSPVHPSRDGNLTRALDALRFASGVAAIIGTHKLKLCDRRNFFRFHLSIPVPR